MNLKTVIDEVGSWPVEDRLRLIEEVWDSIAAAPEAVVLTETQKQDLERRLDLYRDNPKAGSPWEEVKARLQGGVR
jgi:putative addiction module component (TIGR02574 family)